MALITPNKHARERTNGGNASTTPTIAIPSASHWNARFTLRCSHAPTCTKLRIVPITETKARNEAGWRK